MQNYMIFKITLEIKGVQYQLHQSYGDAKNWKGVVYRNKGLETDFLWPRSRCWSCAGGLGLDLELVWSQHAVFKIGLGTGYSLIFLLPDVVVMITAILKNPILLICFLAISNANK